MITGVFGLPGSGKSTFLTKLAKDYQKDGGDVFVNSDFPIDGCFLYDWDDIGKYDMSNSLVLIDEISLYADNRDFKNFNSILKQFFILHRHYHIDIVWCTQQFDGVDRKIRELTSRLYYLRPAGLSFSVATAVQRVMYVPTKKDLKNNPRAEPKLATVRSSLLRLIFAPFNKTVRLCYRPKYYKYFDSYDAPLLAEKTFTYYERTPPPQV